jgi:hypothetical protein
MEERVSLPIDVRARTDELMIEVGNFAEGPRKKRLLSALAEIRARLGVWEAMQGPALATSAACPPDQPPRPDSESVVNADSAEPVPPVREIVVT